jgi:hypothetical protein
VVKGLTGVNKLGVGTGVGGALSAAAGNHLAAILFALVAALFAAPAVIDALTRSYVARMKHKPLDERPDTSRCPECAQVKERTARKSQRPRDR